MAEQDFDGWGEVIQDRNDYALSSEMGFVPVLVLVLVLAPVLVLLLGEKAPCHIHSESAGRRVAHGEFAGSLGILPDQIC